MVNRGLVNRSGGLVEFVLDGGLLVFIVVGGTVVVGGVGGDSFVFGEEVVEIKFFLH